MNSNSGHKCRICNFANRQLAVAAALFVFFLQVSTGLFHYHQNTSGLSGNFSFSSEALIQIPGESAGVNLAAPDSAGHQESTCSICMALHNLRSASCPNSFLTLPIRSAGLLSQPTVAEIPLLAELRPAAAPRAPPTV